MERRSKRAGTPADRVLGSKQRAARVAMGLTQAQVGQALGVSFQQLQKYENGTNRISAVGLKVLADLFGASVADLLTVGANEPPMTYGPSRSRLRT